MKEEFPIPHMILCRGDIEDETLRNSLTDDDMREIAQKMSKGFMQDWALMLKLAIEEVEE